MHLLVMKYLFKAVFAVYGSLRQVQWHVNYRPCLQKMKSEVNETHVSLQTADMKNTWFNEQH